MPNLIQRAKKAIFRKDYAMMENLTNAVLEEMKWHQVGQSQNIESAVKQLKEVSGPYFDELLLSIQNYQVSPVLTNEMRLGKVAESRYMYIYDPMVQYIIELWTDFGFGQKPDVIPRDSNALAIWKEFWTDPNNEYVLGERTIQNLSNTVLKDGEFFFVFFISKNTGKTTVRVVETDGISSVIKLPGDNVVPLFWQKSGSINSIYNYNYYKGKYSTDAYENLYYTDYRQWMMCDTWDDVLKIKNYVKDTDLISTGFNLASEMRADTDVVLMQIAFRMENNRGWPLMTASTPWVKTYSDFLRWRAAVQAASASVVEKIKAKTGQRGIDSIKSAMQSSLTNSGYSERNPSASAGSVWIENEALSRDWMIRPTGAGDAQNDGAALMAEAGLGGKIYPHWLGRGESYRLATATSMEAPVYRSFNRYQGFWSSVWRDVLKILVHANSMYNPSAVEITNVDADVNTDAIINTDLNDISVMMGQVSQLSGIVEDEAISKTEYQLIKAGLQTLGIPDIDDVLGSGITQKGVDREEPEEEPEEEMMESIADYASRMNGIVAGYWSGSINENEFWMGMLTLLEVGLKAAWIEGMESVGIPESEMSAEERIAMMTLVSNQWQYIQGFADFIRLNSKANGGKLGALQPRIRMWVNRYNEAKNQALQLAQNDPPLKWILGNTEENCKSCLRYNGKVKRASYWEKIGARPQSPDLECKGINCDCKLEPTTEKLSRGYLTPPP